MVTKRFPDGPEVHWFGRRDAAWWSCCVAIDGGATSITVEHHAIKVAEWTPDGGWIRHITPAPAPVPEPSPLEALEADMLSTWVVGKLSRYCNAVPKMLLLAIGDEDLPAVMATMPRTKGPYTLEDLSSAAADKLTAEVGSDITAWTRLLGWALRYLYPEWERRTGKRHGSAAYAEWLAWDTGVVNALNKRMSA